MKRTHTSARYPSECPADWGGCGAAQGEPCRTKTTGKVADTHAARIKASSVKEQNRRARERYEAEHDRD